MNLRIDVIYSRQSVDKKNSISIVSQNEFCKLEMQVGPLKVYHVKGDSGMSTDNPTV